MIRKTEKKIRTVTCAVVSAAAARATRVEIEENMATTEERWPMWGDGGAGETRKGACVSA